MSYKIELPGYYWECPQWWQSFVRKYTFTERRELVNSNHGEIIYLTNGAVDYIKFPSEAHFTWFLLNI